MGLACSLALHGVALAVALAGLTGAATPPGQGEPTAIEVMFAAGPVLDGSSGVGQASAAASSPAEPSTAPVAVSEAELVRDEALVGRVWGVTERGVGLAGRRDFAFLVR